MINIVGGCGKDMYLNEVAKKYTCKSVVTGPVEATALSNLKIQFLFSNA